MILRGEKVILRAIEEEDNEMLMNLLNDPNTEMLLGGWSFPLSKHDQEKWYNNLSNDKSVFRSIVSVNDIAIGTVILNNIDYKNGTACINIKLANVEYRGKGYGTDAIKTVVNYAFNELRLNCVYAFVLDYNYVSQKLFNKCGFVKEGVLRSRIYKQGKHNALVSFSIINGEQN